MDHRTRMGGIVSLGALATTVLLLGGCTFDPGGGGAGSGSTTASHQGGEGGGNTATGAGTTGGGGAAQSGPVTISGSLMPDAEGMQILGVEVTLDGMGGDVTADGAFKVTSGDGPRHVLVVRAPGYMPLVTIVQTDLAGVKVALSPLVEAVFGEGAATLEVADPSSGAAVSLARADLVDEAGAAPDPMLPLILGLRAIDPSKEPMPGDDSAVDVSGKEVFLQSLGAIYFGVRDAAGKRYDLAPGKNAELKIPPNPTATLSDSVRAWAFDMKKGLWRGEGVPEKPLTVTLQGKFYHGTLPGSGFVNADLAWEDAACLRIVVSEAGVAASDLPLCFLMNVPFSDSIQTRGQCFNAGTIGMYSLPANSLVTFTRSPGYGMDATGLTSVTVNTGAPWGGTGEPSDINACNGQLLIPPIP